MNNQYQNQLHGCTKSPFEIGNLISYKQALHEIAYQTDGFGIIAIRTFVWLIE